MEHLRSLLPKVLYRKGLHKHASAALVCWKAHEWIQRNLPSCADALRPSVFSDSVLSIESSNSVAAQEMQCSVVSLLSYLQKECPTEAVASIQVPRQK